MAYVTRDNVRSLKLIREYLKVRSFADADDNSLKIVLYRCEAGLARGWFVGPLVKRDSRFVVTYEPKSAMLLAVLAIIRGLETAEAHGLQTYIVDPDDVWNEVWSDSRKNEVKAA